MLEDAVSATSRKAVLQAICWGLSVSYREAAQASGGGYVYAIEVQNYHMISKVQCMVAWHHHEIEVAAPGRVAVLKAVW